MRTVLAVTRAELGCMVRTARLLAQRRLAQPRDHVGTWVRFADGTTSRIYRETVLQGATLADPAVLVVRFRLRLVGRRRWAHALFRIESVANTFLFAGHDGFRSKLWMAHDEDGCYRGLYQWDGATSAETYVATLRVVLRPWVVRGSVDHTVIAGARRDELLEGRGRIGDGETDRWWLPVVLAPARDDGPAA